MTPDSSTREPIRISRLAVGAVAVLVGIVVITLGLFSARQERRHPERTPATAQNTRPDFLDEELAKALGRQAAPTEPRTKTRAEGYEFLTGEKQQVASQPLPAPRYAAPRMPRPSARPTRERQRYEEALASSLWSKAPALQSGELLPERAPSDAAAKEVKFSASSAEYVLPEGSLIPARLITAIETSLPGSALAQVTRDVYDARQKRVLIPAGAKLIGRYEDQVAYGESRLLIAWSRLLFPDGRSMELPGLPSHSPSGESGAEGQVDRHFWQAFAPALLVSALGMASDLPQLLLQKEGSTNVNVSLGTPSAGQVASELSLAARSLLQRSANVHPTIRIPAGAPALVFATRDIDLGHP